MANAKSRYAKLKDRARRSANNVEDRKGGTKKKYFFLNTDPSVVGEKEIEFFKPKYTTGRNKNIIDILPYPITQGWYKDLLAYNKDTVGLEEGDLDYKLEVPVHTIGEKGNKKQFLCLREALGRECPICKEMFEFYGKDNKTKDDQAYANSLQPRWRVFYNVFDYAEPDKGIQIMEMAFSNFEKFLMMSSGLSSDGIDDETDNDPIYFFELEDGMSLKFSGIKDTFGTIEYVKVASFDFADRNDQYDDEVLDQTYPLDKMLPVPSYKEVADAFSNQYEDDTDEAPKDEATKDAPKDEAPKDDFNDSPAPACPEGGVFGANCNEFNECTTCDEELFDMCSKEQVNLKGDEKVADKGTEEPVRKRSFGSRV